MIPLRTLWRARLPGKSPAGARKAALSRVAERPRCCRGRASFRRRAAAWPPSARNPSDSRMAARCRVNHNFRRLWLYTCACRDRCRLCRRCHRRRRVFFVFSTLTGLQTHSEKKNRLGGRRAQGRQGSSDGPVKRPLRTEKATSTLLESAGVVGKFFPPGQKLKGHTRARVPGQRAKKRKGKKRRRPATQPAPIGKKTDPI